MHEATPRYPHHGSGNANVRRGRTSQRHPRDTCDCGAGAAHLRHAGRLRTWRGHVTLVAAGHRLLVYHVVWHGLAHVEQAQEEGATCLVRLLRWRGPGGYGTTKR